jgi:hypothetical protein
MASSTWVGDLTRKFRQELQELVDLTSESGLSPCSFRAFVGGLRALVNSVGVEAFVRAVEAQDETVAGFERKGRRLRFRDVSAKDWLTPFGRASISRRVYAADGGGAGDVPLDEACGMTGQFMTPDVAEMAMFAVALITPREVEQLLAKTLPEGPSSTAVQHLLEQVGDVLDARQNEIEAEVRKAEPLSEDGDVLVASWDGVMTAMREDSGIAWREAAVGAISVYGQCEEGPDKLDTRYFARMPESGMVTLITQIEGQVEALMTSRPFREFVVLCDGKREIWKTARKSRVLRNATFILDFYHAAEHLSAAAKAIHGDTPVARRWFEKRREQLQLETGAVSKILRSLRRALASLPPSSDAHETVRKTISYFTTHRRRMRYAEYLARGLPIGSGPVEAAAKTVVQGRLKRSGMRWSRDGGQRVLDLRTHVKSDRWESMWSAYLNAA